MTEEKRAQPPAAAPAMFGTLLASRPERNLMETVRSGIGSITVHVLIVGGLVWATMSVGAQIVGEEEVTVFELPPEEPVPPPPPPPAPTVEAVAGVEIAKGFQTLTVPDVVPPDIPPPSLGVTFREEDFSGMGREGGKADGSTDPAAKTVDALTLAPTFTPMTIRPELKNPEEVGRALQRNYPPLLRDAGIGGNAVLWFLIDETGTVVRTQIKESSGHRALDDAATKVAEIMKFRPAYNRDKAVPVWVEIPIRFSTN